MPLLSPSLPRLWRAFVLALCSTLGAAACHSSSASLDAAPPRADSSEGGAAVSDVMGRDDASDGDRANDWRLALPLPEPLSNNAVSAAALNGSCRLYSFLGIGPARDAGSISNAAYVFDGAWRALPQTPGPPRLAASAVTIRDQVYVVGGYTVAPDGREVSVRRVDVLDTVSERWSAAADLPIAIDDAVVAAWRDRWIVVVSGWSDSSNRPETQLYDVETNSWVLADAFPGTPAFGHSGAIAGDTLVVIDGVRDRPFTMIEQSWMARLDPSEPGRFEWTALEPHPGSTRYRSAAGITGDGRIAFVGGTSDPYNFDGLTYDGSRPAQPLASTLVFDPAERTFTLESLSESRATMDHRALLSCEGRQWTVGGMLTGPRVSADVWTR